MFKRKPKIPIPGAKPPAPRATLAPKRSAGGTGGKGTQEPDRSESPYQAARRRALEKQRHSSPPEPPDPTPDQQKPKRRRRRPWEKPPDALFWSLDELILFPLDDDDVIIIADTGETRRFAEPSYDAQGRRLYPSSIKAVWQQIVLFYFILGVIVGAAGCYLFLKDALCW